ncbi:polyphosphate polymerase domain-containing protein [Natronincola ferrireducens]|uniref:VTC domain-containing protein n=1 Tax=Natronincola ferrireducens TaxID=393762 RepID=A0A1G8X345_9FIRM|nr:polyphosphate polymerase domain-containing protein [Natronincola ferrireducens]SDJ85079.1 VTC domain-containing protein [Natronincola ferrireducens]
MAQEVFNRYELKYLIHQDIYRRLLEALKPHISMDVHGDKEGYYTISNIYYDTEDNLFHREKMLGQPFRQKLRLRVYNEATLDDWSFFEIKQKHKGVVNKRRTLIKLKDAYRFLSQKETLKASLDFEVSNHQILKEIDFLKNFYQLKPKMVLCYERQAFQAIENSDIRITFDKNLRKREYNYRLENGSDGELFMDSDVFVLEVKLRERMPLWLARILSEYRCAMQSFSKYSNSHSNKEIVVPEKHII